MTARGWLVLVAALAVVAFAIFSWPRIETDPPELAGPDALVLGPAGAVVRFDAFDRGAGLRWLQVELAGADEPRVLAAESFPGHWARGGSEESGRIELTLDAAALGLPDGPALLVVRARDWSWRDNQSQLRLVLSVDTRPPAIQRISGLTYVARGGSGAFVYALDEPTERDGVVVGDAFFAGHPLPGGEDGQRVALFAAPVGVPPGAIELVARDRAGNSSRMPLPVRVMERRFADSEVSLGGAFLERVVPPLAEANGIDASDPRVAFRRLNREIRAANETRIRELTARSEPRPLWRGAFQQWPGSVATSRFAEHRRYRVGGEVIGSARHFGFDLAATANAPVTAANAGVVGFAGELGIYGSCVIVDHGLGLFSLYAHLSRLDVAPGLGVERGDTLGLSGASGLAGGDHLHFAMLVGSEYVDPLEWWDPRWVESHVDVRLGEGETRTGVPNDAP